MKTLVGASFIALGLATADPAQADTRLVINCFAPAQHPICAKILPSWVEQVEQVTEGRVRINIPAKSMAPPPDQLASVRGGIFDGAVQFNGFISDEIVGPSVSLLPFTGASDARANSIALWRTYDKYLAAANEYKGVHLLGLFASGGADFYSMTDAPIDSMASLTGRKMWALPGVTANMLKDQGAPVVSGPAVQMSELIQRGVVDGYVGIPASATVQYSLLPYTSSATWTKRKILVPSFSFFVGDDSWNKIDLPDRKLIEEVSGEAFADLAGGIWADTDHATYEKIKNEIKIVQASDSFEAELDAASQKYVQAWLEKAQEKGIDGQGALSFYLKAVEELER